MRKGIVLQERDIELMRFLGEYKIITLDNARYIYNTKTYQEKRIVELVKYKYVKRLKHRLIVLGIKGKEYLIDNGYPVIEHCRNENNIERLKVISDISSMMKDISFFTPSWSMKSKDEPTKHSRRYIGEITYDNTFYLAYAIYGDKNDKYIKSIHYDIKKEHEFNNVMIFANDLEKLMFGKDDFSSEKEHVLLVPYNEYGKFILRNAESIEIGVAIRLYELYPDMEFSDYEYADYKLDNANYIKIMLTIDLKWLSYIKWKYDVCGMKNRYIHIFCLEELEPLMRRYLPNCNYETMNKDKINELIEKARIEERKYGCNDNEFMIEFD